VVFPIGLCYYARVKAGWKIFLWIVGFLLAVSVIVSQALFRIERTLLSYTFMAAQLEGVSAPLADPSTQADAAVGAITYLQEKLSFRFSGRLTPYVREAAINGFDADWFLRTGKRMVFNSQRFLSGEESELSLPVSFDSFKLALLDIAGAELDAADYLEVEREVSQIDSSIDLGSVLSEKTQMRISAAAANRRVIFIILIYIVPFCLALLCFPPRELGSGLFVSGLSLLAGGACLAVSSFFLRNLVSRASSSAFEKALPDFLGWIADGTGMFAGKVVSGILPAGAVIGGAGLVIAACKVYLSRKKRGYH